MPIWILIFNRICWHHLPVKPAAGISLGSFVVIHFFVPIFDCIEVGLADIMEQGDYSQSSLAKGRHTLSGYHVVILSIIQHLQSSDQRVVDIQAVLQQATLA